MAVRVNPTRMELTRLKKRLKTAVRGHKLLKDKRDEMVRRFMGYIRRDKELREEVEAALAAALGRAAVAGAEMGGEALTEALLYPARLAKVKTGTRNIMSVDVPTVQFIGTDEPADLPYGFAFTSSELDGAVLDLAALLPKLLEHVMIPEMNETIRFITMKLEENERGNQNRLMKVKEMMVAE